TGLPRELDVVSVPTRRSSDLYDPEREVSYVPYVVETSIGCDRMFLALMSRCLTDELVPDADGKESERTVLKLPPALAPVKCAVRSEEHTSEVQSRENLVGRLL